MKKITACIAALFFVFLCGCGTKHPANEYQRFSTVFYGTFDTVVQVIGYCKSEEEFTGYAETIKDRFTELNNLYDIYYEYSGINNIKTINNNAGIAPVEVSDEILDLMDFCLEWYDKSGGQVNIALGPVTSIWHSYMQRYAGDSTDAKLPAMEKLLAAKPFCDISKVIVDHDKKTVYLAEEGMSLDIGAVAKGYATELVCREMYDAGFTSFVISAGGNVVALDAPADGSRAAWGIGIQDPFDAGKAIDTAYVTNTCVVTSGDYQRYYMAGEQRIHHIIDPATLMPSDYYRGVTVITEDSGIADLASTTLFTLPYEESRALAEKMGWKALWVFADGSIELTDDMIPLLKERGNADKKV